MFVVNGCWNLKYNSVLVFPQTDVEENIFSPSFLNWLTLNYQLNTKLEVLIKMLRKSIKRSTKDTNKIAAEKNMKSCWIKLLKNTHNKKRVYHICKPLQRQKQWFNYQICNSTGFGYTLKIRKTKKVLENWDWLWEKTFYDILMHLRQI
jgi:hypothetical protein